MGFAIWGIREQRLACVAMGLLMPCLTEAQEPQQLPEVEVLGEAVSWEATTVEADGTAASRPGTAELLQGVPGANVNFNGPLTGVAQYRGLFGNRLNVLVDGVYTNSACPNEMEPPLHYVSVPRLESLTVLRGIAPVSSGIETLGTTVYAKSKNLPFGAGEPFEFKGNLGISGHTVDDGYSVGALVGAANESHRLQVGATRDKGSDMEFGEGTVRDSGYERNAYELGYGLRAGPYELGLGYLRNETQESGTPALPMDIIFVDTDIVNASFQTGWGSTRLVTQLSFAEVDHRMDNFSLRPAPPQQRYSDADSRGRNYKVEIKQPVGGGDLALGIDGNLTDQNATVYDPNNAAFFLENFDEVERNRYGFYGEWAGQFNARWGAELGLRYTRVTMDAGEVDATAARSMPGPRTLRDRFNSADRDISDDNVDAVAKLSYQIQPELAFEVGVGRKTRSPSYQERYLWIPVEASGGLADGNLYVGSLELEPEVSNQLDVGLDWQTPTFHFSPRAFYNRVNDYIQGTPATDPVVVAVGSSNGDPTPLQFNNVDAEFYGIDLAWGAKPGKDWRVDGTVSYVRGKRRDIADDIYRVAPLNGSLALTYEQAGWSATAEGVFYAKQDKVSETNGEVESAGYGLLNLFGERILVESGNTKAKLQLGVANVFDKSYQPHLNGINRVLGSDVAVGEHLPGPGRNFYAQISVDF